MSLVGQLLHEAKLPKMTAPLRRKLNTELQKVLKKTYFKSIPLDDITKALEKGGVVMTQEDHRLWSGMLMGDSAQDSFDLAPKESEVNGVYNPYLNSVLVLSWYKREESGNIEVIGYIS